MANQLALGEKGWKNKQNYLWIKLFNRCKNFANNGEQVYRIQTFTKLVGILKGMKTTYYISSCVFNGFQFRETSSLALKINIISQYYPKCMLENDYRNILLLWQKNIIFTLNFLPKKLKKSFIYRTSLKMCTNNWLLDG